jgi:aryl-alcohol dehydrogenase-like predicted oxidoreductase
MKERLWFGINKKTNPVGFGCWQISGVYTRDNKPNGWGAIDEKEALNILIYAIENGIDFFDTAQGYNNGNSERLLGKAIQHTGKDVVICTKIPLTDEEIANKRIGKNFCERVELSLKNLQDAPVDILLIHNPPDETDWKNFDYRILDALVEKGDIGTYGVSSRSLAGANKAIENNFGTTLEWVFNIFERRPAKVLFPLLEEKKMNFIARSPLSRGLISPKYINDSPVFNADDFRSTLPKEWIEWVVATLRAYQHKRVPVNDITRNAILYCVQHHAVNACIVGIKTKKQIEDLVNISQSIDRQDHFNFDLLNGIPDFFPKWA